MPSGQLRVARLLLESERVLADGIGSFLEVMPAVCRDAGVQESKVTALADTVQAGQFVDRLWRWRSQLQERISASENSSSMELGDVFEHAFSEVLPAYHAWAKNFQAAAAMYLALETNEPRFPRFRERLSDVKKLSGRSLSSFLCWPLHNLRTYVDAWEKLIEVTPLQHKDHDAIVNSLRRTQMLIDTLREELAGVVSFENTIACIRLFSTDDVFKLDLTNPALRWIKQGHCVKMSSKARKQDRELILFNQQLILVKRHSGSFFNGNRVSLELKSTIPIASLKLIDVPENPKICAPGLASPTPVSMSSSSTMSPFSHSGSHAPASLVLRPAPLAVHMTPSVPTQSIATALAPLYSFQLYDDIRYITVCFKTLAEKCAWFNAIAAQQQLLLSKQADSSSPVTFRAASYHKDRIPGYLSDVYMSDSDLDHSMTMPSPIALASRSVPNSPGFTPASLNLGGRAAEKSPLRTTSLLSLAPKQSDKFIVSPAISAGAVNFKPAEKSKLGMFPTSIGAATTPASWKLERTKSLGAYASSPALKSPPASEKINFNLSVLSAHGPASSTSQPAPPADEPPAPVLFHHMSAVMHMTDEQKAEHFAPRPLVPLAAAPESPVQGSAPQSAPASPAPPLSRQRSNERSPVRMPLDQRPLASAAARHRRRLSLERLKLQAAPPTALESMIDSRLVQALPVTSSLQTLNSAVGVLVSQTPTLGDVVQVQGVWTREGWQQRNQPASTAKPCREPIALQFELPGLSEIPVPTGNSLRPASFTFDYSAAARTRSWSTSAVLALLLTLLLMSLLFLSVEPRQPGSVPGQATAEMLRTRVLDEYVNPVAWAPRVLLWLKHADIRLTSWIAQGESALQSYLRSLDGLMR